MFTSQTQNEGNHSQYSLQTPTGVLQKCTCLWRIKIGAIGKSLITISIRLNSEKLYSNWNEMCGKMEMG